MELLRRINGVLPRHRVDDKQRLDRRDGLLDLLKLRHQVVVNLRPPRRVHNGPCGANLPGSLHSLSRHLWSGPRCPLLVHLHVDLPAQRLKLIDSRRTVQVGRYQHRKLARLLQVPRQLRGRRRLAGTVQPDHQDHRRRGRPRHDLALTAVEDGRKLLVRDLDHLLARTQALEHVLRQRPLAYLPDKRPRHPEVYIRLEQRHANLPQRRVNVALSQPPLVPKPVEDSVQLFRQRLEHGGPSSEARYIRETMVLLYHTTTPPVYSAIIAFRPPLALQVLCYR